MHTHHEKIARAIKYTSFAKKNPNDVNDVNFYLSVGDKIDQARLDAHHAEAKKITGTPTPPVTGAPTKIDGEKPAPVEPRAPVPGEAGYKMEGESDETDATTPDDATATVIHLAPSHLSIAAAQRQLVESQVAFRAATERVRSCRTALGAAVARWSQSVGIVTTAEMNAREFIASETQLRADRKAGIAPERGQRRRHRSVIDATADAFNTGSNRAGGGNAFRRVIKLPDGTWTRPRGVHDIGR